MLTSVAVMVTKEENAKSSSPTEPVTWPKLAPKSTVTDKSLTVALTGPTTSEPLLAPTVNEPVSLKEALPPPKVTAKPVKVAVGSVSDNGPRLIVPL